MVFQVIQPALGCLMHVLAKDSSIAAPLLISI